MKIQVLIIALFWFVPELVWCQTEPDLSSAKTEQASIIIGEVTSTSALIQVRTHAAQMVDEDLAGRATTIRFLVFAKEDNSETFKSSHKKTTPENDFIVKYHAKQLTPATAYRVVIYEGEDLLTFADFQTPGGAEAVHDTTFAIVTGMNYEKFYDGPKFDGKGAYNKPDRDLGFPGLESILSFRPDFFIATGDNVYYDTDKNDTAKDAPSMRQKWHEQFAQPRMRALFQVTPTYWMKDDHDHRYNDNDNTGSRKPSSRLGIRIFKEQVPVTDPADPLDKTYRTIRVSRDLQLWFVEGRDYRSPNRSPDDERKTIWGAEQKAWLKQTLLESDATFRLLITPTPMIGPDGSSKRDNHTNIKGFQTERQEIFDWIVEHNLHKEGFYILCGDRHWQYQSIYPPGIEEFSCGALVDNNSRMGVKPGSKNSTDPQGLIQQPYTSRKPSGGFLLVRLIAAEQAVQSRLIFDFYDEQGELLYSVKKSPNPSQN